MYWKLNFSFRQTKTPLFNIVALWLNVNLKNIKKPIYYHHHDHHFNHNRPNHK